MKSRFRHPKYVDPKTKVIKMHDDMHDMMEDMCDMEDIEPEMEECDLADDPPVEDEEVTKRKTICGNVPECIMLAHAYVPWQCYEDAFSPSEALMRGTLFPELWGVYRIPK